MRERTEFVECVDRRTAQRRTESWAVAWRVVPGGYMAYKNANDYMLDKRKKEREKYEEAMKKDREARNYP